jgi:hypothetical protein
MLYHASPRAAYNVSRCNMVEQDKTLSYSSLVAPPRNWRPIVITLGVILLPFAMLALVDLYIVVVKSGAQPKLTKVKLRVMIAEMDGYLRDGNPEPDSSASTDPSRMDILDYVAKFQKDPARRKNLQNLCLGTYEGKEVVFDGYGYPIRYEKSAPGRSGYFQSSGPDGVFGTSDDLFSP